MYTMIIADTSCNWFQQSVFACVSETTRAHALTIVCACVFVCVSSIKTQSGAECRPDARYLNEPHLQTALKGFECYLIHQILLAWAMARAVTGGMHI